MKFTKLAGNFLFVVFLCGSFIANAFAQCEGVYFKTKYRNLFTEPVVFVPESLPTPERFKDLTGDGKVDFIGTGMEEGSTTKKLYIAPSDGAGGFGSVIEITLSFSISVPNSARSPFRVADFNNDNLNDIFLISAATPRTVQVYRNNGGGSFTPLNTTVLTDAETFFQNIVDLNNDNIADIITGLPDAGYRLGSANGSFGNRVNLIDYDYQHAGDFDGDGDVDFALKFFQNSSDQNLVIYYNQGNGNFTLSEYLLNYNLYTKYAGVRDFNNDGRPDLFGIQDGARFAVTLNLGNGMFSAASYASPFPIAVQNANIGDFNGDGFLDFIAIPQTSETPVFYSRPLPRYTVFINDGTGANFTRRDYNTPFRGYAAGDLDGDNKTDLVSFNNLNFAANQNPRRLFNETQISITKNVCKKPGQTKIVDFDGDTVGDKALFKPSNGWWRVINSGIFLFPFTTSFNWGLNGDITQPGDYDGDGKTDAAVYRPSDGTWYIRNSSNGAYTIIQFGTNGDKPVSGDFDGDETTDLAVFRPSDGNWYIYHTGTEQFSGGHFGIEEDKPVPADYDGDGKTDIAVYRPSNGFWYYLKSSDGGFAAIKWGVSSDTPMPADYDGDGRADLTVFRPLENNWYILRSSNSQYGVFQFGTTGDILQPNDWDGNEIFDLGVFRPFSSTWYSSHTLAQENFGSTGEIPASSLIKPQ
jgi:hypothetical protein